MEDIDQKYHLAGPLARSVPYEEYLEPFEASLEVWPKIFVDTHDMVNVQFTSGSTASSLNS